ncbi:MAG: glycosyltransferase [bacterium]
MKSLRDKFKKHIANDGPEVTIAMIIKKLRLTLIGKIIPHKHANLANYKYPWELYTTSEKLDRICKSPKKKKIVYIFPERDYATVRYRAYNMQQILNKTELYYAEIFFENELSTITSEIISNVDLVILVRTFWTQKIENIIGLAIKKEIPVIYDIDDLVFIPDAVPTIANHLNYRETPRLVDLAGKTLLNRIIMQRVGGFITTNQFLQNIINAHFPGKPCYVIPNFLNDEQVLCSKEIIDADKINHQPFKIGYFSGSSTHQNDFDLIANQLVKLLENNPDIELKIVGDLNISRQFEPVINQLTITGLKNYLQLQKEIASVDINLVPLVYNEFNNCKSELKFFEAGIVRVPTIASPNYSYRNAIQNGENGFLAGSANDWSDLILNLKSDKSLYQTISENAYQSSINKYHKNREEIILPIIKSIIK